MKIEEMLAVLNGMLARQDHFLNASEAICLVQLRNQIAEQLQKSDADKNYGPAVVNG